MKVLLVGANDLLAKAFLERMAKEDHETYLLAREDFSAKKAVVKHKFFALDGKRDSVQTVFRSVEPDAVVFAGDDYMGAQLICEREWRSEGYLELLEMVLQSAALIHPSMFVYLSSTAVYGTQPGLCTESSAVEPSTALGMCVSQGEYMAQQYGKIYNFPVAVLRSAAVYSDVYDRHSREFMGKAIRDISSKDVIRVDSKKQIQAVHVRDLVDAILRAADAGKTEVYNVASDEAMSHAALYGRIEKNLGISTEKTEHAQQKQALVDCSKIKSKLEWTDFHKIDEVLQDEKYWQSARDALKKHRKQDPSEDKKKVPTGIRKTLENIVVFAVFFLLYYYTGSHALFSTVHWMLIYVTVISVFWGLRQSLLAVVLASGAYLFVNGVSLLQMSNFYSYADCVLMIAEFVFFGVTISYTLDVLKENVRDTKHGYELLSDDYQELKEINRENVLIKQEYEKRLLVSKTGISKLYAVVSRLMNSSPEVIMKEILNVVAEMMETGTVAVYSTTSNKRYLRLVNALNKDSVMGGKSWDIAGMGKIAKAIEENKLYEGDVMEGEPAIVMPIPYRENTSAVILIKDLPYTSHTLFHTNMLKTLALLVNDSMTRALDYDEVTRSTRYVKDTDILVYEEFVKQVQLAKEKADEGLADYSIIRLEQSGQNTYEVADPLLRGTDFFGQGKDGQLYVLLNNTDSADMEAVMARLSEKGIEAKTVQVEA